MCSADIPVCGFTGLSSPVFRGDSDGTVQGGKGCEGEKIARSRRLESPALQRGQCADAPAKWRYGLAFVLALAVATSVCAQPAEPLAFPDAEGFGCHATGGRGGEVYFVTNLNDDGPGSLRHGIMKARQPRTILFKVSGTIRLKSGLSVSRPNLTIAGQSAPGDGICIRDYGVNLSADDLILRHLRFRLGTHGADPEDALTVTRGNNIIVDHCSASWSIDETLSASGRAQNLTVQWCYITESLNQSVHRKGEHGYGSLIRPRAHVDYTFHHNLYAHHSSRVPRPGSYRDGSLLFDFRNNLLYDWGHKAGYSNYDYERVRMNYVGNYLQAGPSTTWLGSAFEGAGELVHIFQEGNRFDVNRDGRLNGEASGWDMFNGVFTKVNAGFEVQPVATDSANLAYRKVLSGAGAVPWRRDAVDERVTAQVLTGGGGIIDSTEQAGGWPELASAEPPADRDQDGMPDDWEQATGSDPEVSDHNGDVNGNGYTNLEDYLNWLGAPHGLTPMNQAVDLDLTVFTMGFGGPEYLVLPATHGTVSILDDGRTARFQPAGSFSGLAGVEFTVSADESVMNTVIPILITSPGN